LEGLFVRKIILFVALFCFIHPALAEDKCEAQKAVIDKRLENPGYTAKQIEQGKKLKEQIDLMCSMGGPQVADMLIAQLDQILPLPTAEDVAMSKLSPDDLTNEYLKGEWCRGGQEATSYDFAADGSYRYAVVGFNVGPDGHHYFPEKRTRAQFFEKFDHLRSKDENEFVMSIEQNGKHVETKFTRGKCSFMSAGGAG
jgi:hypothetical protein